jgi:hypothetical protein
MAARQIYDLPIEIWPKTGLLRLTVHTHLTTSPNIDHHGVEAQARVGSSF